MSYIRLFSAHWKNSIAWLVCGGAGMLGLWGAGLLVFFFLQNPPWLQLFDRGQFFLYSVGFLSQAMYILTKERKITTIPHRGTLFCCTAVTFLVCTLMFAGYVFANFADSANINARTVALRWVGLSVLVVSVAIGFLVTIANEERTDVDIPELGQSGVRRLEDQIPEGPV